MKNIQTEIISFRQDLTKYNSNRIFKKYLVNDTCYALSNDEQMLLREEISKRFNIDYQNIIIVGSAKLGFSIKAKRRFMNFCDTSDIDIALISKDLFEKIWLEVSRYFSSMGEYEEGNNYCNYLAKNGWIRPDKLPNIQIKDEWFEFFRELTNSGKYGDYKISAGLYYNYSFLEEYQLKCIDQCKECK